MAKAMQVATRLVAVTVGCAAVLAVALFLRDRERANAPRTVVRPTPTILMSVRDLARLETNELHMEKVVDLSDKQSRFFGLFDSTDAILLVAAGDVTIGIDLKKL